MNIETYKMLIEEAKKQNINRYVVGAIIEKDSSVLLLKRSKDDFMGGIYEFPSGKVEGKEDLEAALFREVKEETDLKVKDIIRYLGHFDYKSKSGKKTRQFNFLVTINEPAKVRLSEHEDFAWVKKDQLQNYAVTNSVKNILYSLWG
ncbi:ADP-ribose pyrophosphatase [uncultured archaeon]|nr:ADP-ribose pyrophosphatase [uncultured archaeon]